MSDYLQLAVRAYAEPVANSRGSRTPRQPKHAPRNAKRRWRRPRMLLVFDTETAIDVGQALLFGCVRVYRITKAGAHLVEESLFHADDLAERDGPGYGRLASYAEQHGLPLRSRREFVDDILWPVGYVARAWIVGFNLPFDLSRLAIDWTPRKQAGSRGFSLALWDYFDEKQGEWRASRYRPRITVETIDSKRALIRFGRVVDPRQDFLIPEDDPTGEPSPKYTFPGNFLDLRTLAFALTGEGHSLDTACDAFHVEHKKTRAKRHGVITAEYIGYCRRDVLATFELLENLLTEYERHPIALRPTKARSPASIAKAYLDAMGIVPFLQKHPEFPRELLGKAMAAYVGGRVETRLRRQVVPVVYVDFLSMYPTVNANMALWKFFTCERIEIGDATVDARRLVDHIEFEDLF